MKYHLTVFLDDEKKVTKKFTTANTAKQYASSVINNGFVHDQGHRIEQYPPHRIMMVRVDDIDAIEKIKKSKKS